MRDALLLNKKLLLLAVVFSLLAAGSVYWYLSSLSSGTERGEMVPVVTAAQDIPKNTVIEEKMLVKTEIPREYAQGGVINNIKDAEGKVAQMKILQGQQVLSKALIQTGDRSAGLAYAVPKGRRAVSVAINEVSGLDGQLMPGDRVDVAATLDFSGSGGGDITQTSIILQDIEVLAVGRVLEAEKQSWAQRGEMEKTVTLAVLPEEAQPLILASERGSIRMLLRSPADSGKPNLGSLQLNDMLRGR
jgi:pilus assembly protein CpaB